jgi:hypothetical protein
MLMRQTVTSATGFGAARSRRCRRALGEHDRPAGHNFATTDQALAWGHEIREKIAESESYLKLGSEINSDFNTTDSIKRRTLSARPAKGLCPQHIWQSRNSATSHTSPLG